MFLCFFFCKQKTAYEMRISDWSSDVCSSDLPVADGALRDGAPAAAVRGDRRAGDAGTRTDGGVHAGATCVQGAAGGGDAISVRRTSGIRMTIVMATFVEIGRA